MNYIPFNRPDSSNEVFQKKMQFAFEGMEGPVQVTYDDVLVWKKIKIAMTKHSEMFLREAEKY